MVDVAAPLKYFRWEPTVSGASPDSGSPTGGTLLTITGERHAAGSRLSAVSVQFVVSCSVF